MDLNTLDYFFAAADYGNFTRAAKHCNIAQTTMSKYIAALEEDLGTKLFDRTTRSCTLTEAGQLFYTGMKKIHMDYEALCHQLKNSTENELRIGIYGEYLYLAALQKYKLAFPDVQLLISFEDHADLLEDLTRQRVNAILLPTILIREPISDPNLQTVNISRDKAFLYCSKAAFERFGSVEAVITNLPMVTKASDRAYHEQRRQLLQKQFGAAFQSVALVESTSKQLLLVDLSQAFTIMLQSELPDHHDYCTWDLDKAFDITLQLVYDARHNTRLLQQFIEFIRSTEE